MHSNLIVELPIMKSTSLVKANFKSNYIKSIANLSESILPFLINIDLGSNRIT